MIGTRGVPASYGGTETYVQHIAYRLAERGDEVVVYCKKAEDAVARETAEASVPTNVQRIELPSIGGKHLDNLVRSFLSALHACLFSGADVVQFNNVGPSLFCFLPRLFGKVTVCAVRAIDSKREKWNPLAQAFLRFCEYVALKVPNATTVNGKSMRDYYLTKYRVHTIYIPNGVELPTSQGESEKLILEYGLRTRGFILFAARLEPEKGCHTLIEAYLKVIATIPTDVKLVIAGHQGFSTEYVRSLHLSESDRVLFVGNLDSGRLNVLYENALGFVLPSSVEGMSNSLLAAMAHGLPVIVSDIPENAAVIDDAPFSEELDDHPGIQFKLNSADDLAKKLGVLIRNPAAAELRGQLLREHVRRTYTLRQMIEETRSLYSKLLSGRQLASKAE